MKRALAAFLVGLGDETAWSNPYNDDPCWSRLQSCNNSCLHSSDVNACALKCGYAYDACVS